MSSQISASTAIAIQDSEPKGDLAYRVPRHEPNHSSMQPKKSCLKPSRYNLDDDEAFRAIYEVVMFSFEDPPEVTKSVGIADLVITIESDGLGWHHNHKEPRRFGANLRRSKGPRCEETSDDTCSTSPESGAESMFPSEDMVVGGRIAQAKIYRDVNERASIIRGSLDFLMAVWDITHPDSQRITKKLERLRFRSIGSYVDEEKEFVNDGVCTFKVPEDLYRSKETAMSWKRREQAQETQSLG
ncbi:hypothetical protein ACHAPU_007492 [Fusarium lateritium]